MIDTYQKQGKSWHILSEEERKRCCREDEQDAADQPQDCIDNWKQQLNAARKAMKEAAARYDKASKRHNSAAAWESKLKNWKEDAEAAHKKALEVYDELVLFLEAVSRLKTGETATAIKAVLCLVKCIFDAVNELLRVSNSADDPTGKIQALKQWIECEGDLEANTREKALSCIKSFEEEMKGAYDAQKNLLDKLLEILHGAHVLVAAVDKCDEKDEKDEKKDVNLKWQLDDLKSRISGKWAGHTKRVGMCGCGEPPPSTDLPCDSDIVNPPGPFFPIRSMEPDGGIQDSEDSAYYKCVKELHGKAETRSNKTRSEMEDARKARDEGTACYNGLNDAIKAAEAARPSE